MAQPAASGLTLNAGDGGGELAKTTHGGFDYQWAFACWWEETGSSPEVPSLASPFPVQPGTSTTWVLGAGTAEFGKLAAGSAIIGAVTQSGTWNVGTVTTVTTVSTVTNLAQLGGQAVSMGTGVRDAGTQRVTIATNDAVPVTGTFWQGTQPVSLASVPTHAVTQSGTWNVSTVTTVSSVTAIANALPAGNNNIGNVDIVTLPSGNLGAQAMAASLSTTLATDDTHFGTVGAAADVDGVVHGQLRYIGEAVNTIDADTGAIKTAVELLDDAIYVDDADWIDNTSKHMLVGGIYQSTPHTVTDGDVSPIQVDQFGRQLVNIAAGVLATLTEITDNVKVEGPAAEGAAASNAPVLVGGRYDSTLRTLDDGDVGALAVSPAAETILISQAKYIMYGAERCEVKHFHLITSTDDATIIAAVGSKKFLILSLSIIGLSATATNVHLETKTGNTDCFGDSTSPIPIAVDADGNNTAGVVLPWNPGGWCKSADANDDLVLRLSAAQPVMVVGSYIEVA